MDTPITYDEKIVQAVKVVEATETTKQNPTIVLKGSGVVLRLKKVNVLRINAINDRFRYPEVPKLFDENKGRELRNPDDPNYKAACAEVDEQRMMAILDAIAVLGTEIVSVPEGVPALADNTWVEELQFLQIPVDPDSPLARYMAWIKYVAIKDQEDLMTIGREFGLVMGNSEVMVADSIATNFPDQATRTTN